MPPSPRLEDVCFTDPAFWLRDDREAVFAAFRRDAPVSWQVSTKRIARGGFWSLTRFNEVEQVSRDWKTFSSRLGSSIEDETEEMAQTIGGMLNMDAPEHVRLRRIVNKSFAPAAMTSLMKSIHHNAVELVDNIIERGECDFARDIATPYPVAVICDLLGAPPADRKYLQQLTTTALCADLPEFGGREGSGYQAFADLNEYGAQMASERRAQPRDDMIGLIVAANTDGEPLSDEEVGIYFQLLVTAGIETTGTATSQGLLALVNHPEQRSRWCGNFDALAGTAVEELVRYTTPIIHFARTATRDVVLGGHEVSAGDKVVMWYNSSNRDEAEFTNPNGLDIGRAHNPHHGFGGGGRHFCLGANLARAEMKAIFAEVLNRLPDLEIIETPVFLPSRFVNGIRSMPCRYTPGKRATQ